MGEVGRLAFESAAWSWGLGLTAVGLLPSQRWGSAPQNPQAASDCCLQVFPSSAFHFGEKCAFHFAPCRSLAFLLLVRFLPPKNAPEGRCVIPLCWEKRLS